MLLLKKHVEFEFLDIEENAEYTELIEEIVNECFSEEKINDTNLYLNVILTNPKNIKEANKKYRNIEKETDVLSFPMFEKEEIDNIIINKQNDMIVEDVIGDIIVSIPRVKEQAIEFGHSFNRELAYMIVHGFYHVMGYDHMEESDKVIMREKEENIRNKLNIKRF